MIHGQYIKGAYQASSTATIPYTFLDFAGAYNSTNQEAMLPTIRITDTNAHPDSDLGHIMVSGIVQHFEKEITFDENLKSNFIYTKTGDEMLDGSEGSSGFLYVGSDYTAMDLCDNAVVINSDSIQLHKNCTAQAISATSLTSSGKCEAQYFNATSDRRAKTDIKPINQSVLPLITNTQLYSFKYKDLDTPSIGIIAQDVQDVDFNGFSLVDNKEATGQDMDYMSIHESKLIYVLGKAVQEQQKEIEELKAQIKKGL